LSLSPNRLLTTRLIISYVCFLGVVAGSVAAGVQSVIGNVAAGSAFAALQSIGAAGLTCGAKAAIGGVAALASYFW